MIDLRLKYGTNNIPILSNEKIDEHAEALIGDYDSRLLSKPQAIDVEDFAENYLGLHFHFTDLSHNGFIWGRMFFNDEKIIVYNPDTKRPDEEPVDASTIVIDNGLLDEKKEHAFRSTVMHESGHAIYHDEYYYIDYYQLPFEDECEVEHLPYTSCEAKNILGTVGSSRKLLTDLEWIEHQAKYFSAASLMPRKTMCMLCANPAIQQFCFREHPGYENDALIAMVSKTYNVSYESARIRIKELGLNYISPSPAPDSYYLSGNYYSIPLL
jgi:hypothetical protein